MADPRLEQERILPRLQRLLDVVSSWADRMPGARAPNAPSSPSSHDVPDGDGARDRDSDGGMDAERAHGSAAGTGRRHARATEPIWHMVTGQDARVPPGLPGGVTPALGPEPALATARVGESMTTAVGIGHMSGIRAARSAASSSMAVTGVAAASGDVSASPSAARDAAVPAQDAAVLQPLLGQDTPPLFGRAKRPGRAATGSDTSAPATRVPDEAAVSGHPATLNGARPDGPGTPLAPAGVDTAGTLDGAGGRAPDNAADSSADRESGHSELEEGRAGVLENAARDAGENLSPADRLP